jgi:hypothetical protein
VVHLFFAGIPLHLWEPVAASDSIEALDPAGARYRVEEWHTGGTTPSPTGHDLHLVYATRRCLGPSEGDADGRPNRR